MKIRVFKLNWITQRNLEFEVNEEHTEKEQKQAAVDRRVVAVDNRYKNTTDIKVVVSLSITYMQLSTSICSYRQM